MAVREDIKRVFVTKIRTNLTDVLKLTNILEAEVKAFMAKGFQTGGVDAITDEHLIPLGITAAELAQGKTVIDDLVAIVNAAPILNILRNDLGIEEPK